jgi:hypothetical protein
MAKRIKKEHVEALILEALEHEMGGVLVYGTALECAVNPDLRKEWEEYLEQTREHVEVLERLCDSLGIELSTETPGRKVVRHLGEGLVQAMTLARETGDEAMAQLVAAECVLIAETKDHQNWELLGEIAKAETNEETRSALEEAHEQVEDEEDEHLYHTQGWARELWLEHLGLPAVLPPPEEEKNVKTAIGAARAKQQREEML